MTIDTKVLFIYLGGISMVSKFIINISIALLVLSGCAGTPNNKPISSSEYTYAVIIKGVSTQYAQQVVMGLKEAGSINSIDTVELTNNHAEYRVWSQHDSGMMYNELVSVLDKQKRRAKISYVSNKFVIKER